MKIHHLTVEDAIRSLNSRPEGLSAREAARRHKEFGPNRVERVKKEPLALRFLKEFTHFFALILWLAAALAFVAEFSDPGKGMAMLGWAILGVILINGIFSFWQEYRAEKALTALENLLPHQVMALRSGIIEQIPAVELVPGDILILQAGDDIPADCRLVEAFGVRVNNATVTGESLPKARNTEPCKEEDLLLARNVLLAGTSLVSGEARAVVFATGMHTEFGKIAHLTQTAREAPSPLQREIARVSRLVAALASLLGAIFFLIGQAIGLPFWESLIFAIGIIVANVPEGLLPTVTLALAMATQRMAKRNALVRHLPAVETLGSATVICTDKTGTLTQNRMAAKKVFLAGELRAATDLTLDPALAEDNRCFFETALHCHNLQTTERNGAPELLGDPMEIALVRMAQGVLLKPPSYAKVGEVPFDTDRKRLSTLCRTPTGLSLYTKGALEMVLPLCTRVQIGAKTLSLTPELREKFAAAQEALAEKGLRVLAFAWRTVAEEEPKGNPEHDLILLGLVGLEDPPRPEVPDAIRKCFDAGIRVIMVTGDHPHTARAIAREIGLIRGEAPVVICGEELRRLSDIQLQLALDAPEIIFARVGADQKLRIVTALQKKGETVAVTGDGVNDAPALKKADIGIAMGLSGTDVAREAADMVLLDDNFASIVAAIEEGRAVFENIRKFLTYILTSNIPELVPYLAFVLFRIPLPLTIIQILAVDLGTDMLPALGLGMEKPHPGVMQQPPRARRERLLNWPLAARAYLFLGIMEAAAAMAAFFFMLNNVGWRYGEMLSPLDPIYLQATTATLSAIIVMQVMNVFLCRSGTESIFSQGPLGNWLILWGVAAEISLILAIDYTPWGNLVFGTAPIGLNVWLFVLPFAFAMLALEEVRKWVARKYILRA
ncbi:cation-transporting P-type ATPase [Sulfuricella sp.]|uniref:cation-translocating P-type ATPase n=1 Tax=Sulfuricella sp. TaxID=2099377 RepID=UPI002C4EF6E8|nr:cation-transporting P-type ATPase [Sulfuricella sp.]HUX64661.1 cation-transporting P-type ATPase [Sulfuricella sp.]